ARRAADGTKGRAQRSADSAGRRRLRADRDLWRHDSHADARQSGAAGTALHALSCDGAVFTDALRADDGTQSSRGGHGHDYELGEWISRLYRIDSEERSVRLGDSARERIRNGGVRQVAPDP